MKRRLSRILREEGGFTLSEMMVVIFIMLIVLFALYSIFDMGLWVFAFGNDKVEVTENARVALERMEREIRGAYPHNPPSDVSRLDADSADTNAGRITLYNDLDGDGNGADSDETISFYVDGNNLVRKQGSNAAETLTALGPGGALEFKYFNKTDGNEVTSPIADEENVGMVRIKLEVFEDGAGEQDPGQELITNATLRNRGA